MEDDFWLRCPLDATLHKFLGTIDSDQIREDHIVWWGSMVTPVGTPNFGAIVLPVPIPFLYLGGLSTILRNQAFYRRKGGPLRVLTDGLIGRESRIYGLTDADRMRDHYKDC
jgi:hypothetical protein